jgi:hypothetical protein
MLAEKKGPNGVDVSNCGSQYSMPFPEANDVPSLFPKASLWGYKCYMVVGFRARATCIVQQGCPKLIP